MQPYCFPYLGYFQLIHFADEFILYDDAQFIERGWVNRNYILLNGVKHLFTLPLEKASSTRIINSINVRSDLPDYSKLLKKIEMAYKKAPFFERVFPYIEEVFVKPKINVSEWSKNSLLAVLNYLNVSKKILLASEIDYDRGLNRVDKIASIMEQRNAEIMGLPPGSMNIYKNADFSPFSFKVKVVIPKFDNYPQHGNKNDFIPGLSILDLIMNASGNEVKRQLNNYNLSSLQ